MDSSIVHSSCMNAILLLCFLYAPTAVGGSRLLGHAHRNHHTKHSFRPKTFINSNDSYSSPSSPSPPPSPSASPDCDSPTTFDVQSYGAVGDGITDDTEAFQLAWQAACYTQSGVMLVPDGYTFLIQSTMFYGPCKEGITFQVDGIILAPDGPEKWAKNSSHLQWIVFYRADGLVLQGNGLVDGRGENWWNLPCKPHRGPNGTTLPGPCESPTAIRFFDSKNLTLRNLHIRNSPQMHVRFDECESVLIDSINIQSPQLSPNTDGIHFSGSQDVQIYNSIVGTGDDCISIVAGCSNVDIQNMTCGPSHGISIGGLGNHNSQACVKNVSVDHAFIKNSDNGLRIKTWQGGIGWVSGVTFSNVYMQNVRNPIIIDQFYCFTKGCRNESDAVFVTDVMYNNIKGTYDERSPAVHLACSDAMPCTNITLTGVELFPAQGQMIQDPFCWNAYGSISSLTIPLLTCLNNGSPQSLRDPARFHPCQAPY